MHNDLLFSRVHELDDRSVLRVHRTDFGAVYGFGAYEWDPLPGEIGGLVWAFEGSMTVHLGDRRWMLSPRHGAWIPPGVPGDVVPNSFSRAMFIQCTDVPPVPGARRVWVSERAAAALRTLAQTNRSEVARHSWRTARSALHPVDDDGLVIPIPRDPRAYELATALLDDPRDARTLDQWGESLYTSGKTLQRLISRETGLTFPNWRTNIRLNASLPALGRGEHVHDVAAGVGYTSTNGYIDAFKRHFRTTPGHFSKG